MSLFQAQLQLCYIKGLIHWTDIPYHHSFTPTPHENSATAKNVQWKVPELKFIIRVLYNTNNLQTLLAKLQHKPMNKESSWKMQ